MHIAQDLDGHVLAAVGAAEQVAKRTAGNLLVEGDVTRVQLPVAVRCAGGGLATGRHARVPEPGREGRGFELGGVVGLSMLADTTSSSRFSTPRRTPLHLRQLGQVLGRHALLRRRPRIGRAALAAGAGAAAAATAASDAAGPAHHGRRQLLKPPAEYVLQLLGAAAGPAIDDKDVEAEVIPRVEGVGLTDVEPQVTLAAGGLNAAVV